MAKKKSKNKAAVEAPMPMDRQTLRLYGKDVIKDAEVDQEVKLRVAGKVTEDGRECCRENKSGHDL